MTIIDQITKAYKDLSARDKQVLFFAVPIVVALVFYLLVYRPISANHINAMQNLESASDDYFWLRNQQPLAKRDACARLNGDSGSGDYLQRQAKTDGLVVVISKKNGLENIAISSGKGAQVLRYANKLACNGYVIKRLNIKRMQQGSGQVAGMLVVSAPEAG